MGEDDSEEEAVKRRRQPSTDSSTRAMGILRQAKKLGQEYREVCKTGEVAEYEAARILGLELTPARQAGYDALERKNGKVRRLQIKGRCLLPGCKPGQRLGSIDTEKDWDAVLMVLLDENFDATAIYEAQRAVVLAALSAPGSIARNERHALGVAKFKSIGNLRFGVRLGPIRACRTLNVMGRCNKHL